MGLVNELQESAERDDVLTVLRKAKRLSSKLALDEISDWVEQEQAGYRDDSPLPDYRLIPVTFNYDTNGPVPVGFNFVKSGIVPLPHAGGDPKVPERSSITTVLNYVKECDAGMGIYFPVPAEVAEILRGEFRGSDPRLVQRLTFLVKLSDVALRDIPEQVKNKILDWACKLESAGVHGNDLSFTQGERRAAQGVVINISHSTVGQIANDGENLMGRSDG